MLEDLQDIVFRYPGECRLLFKVDMPHGKGITITANDRFNVVPCEQLITGIEDLIGTKVHQIGIGPEIG